MMSTNKEKKSYVSCHH